MDKCKLPSAATILPGTIQQQQQQQQQQQHIRQLHPEQCQQWQQKCRKTHDAAGVNHKHVQQRLWQQYAMQC
jgi:hypothetical protein